MKKMSKETRALLDWNTRDFTLAQLQKRVWEEMRVRQSCVDYNVAEMRRYFRDRVEKIVEGL